jgi:WD40 repeat protein
MFVNIDVRLSAMACKWALSCKKFAVAALPTSLIIGYYSPEVKGWTASVKDKIATNPIISVDFHPSGNIIALGIIDGSIKIVSCSFKKFSDPSVQQLKIDDFPYSGPFEKVDSFA